MWVIVSKSVHVLSNADYRTLMDNGVLKVALAAIGVTSELFSASFRTRDMGKQWIFRIDKTVMYVEMLYSLQHALHPTEFYVKPLHSLSY